MLSTIVNETLKIITLTSIDIPKELDFYANFKNISSLSLVLPIKGYLIKFALLSEKGENTLKVTE